MKYKYLLSIAAVACFLSACEKVIEFKGNEVKTLLVLNGLVMPDSVVKIQLTESRFFLDNSWKFNLINDADVRLWKDGSPVESLQSAGDGYYAGTYVPREGDNLRITASCSGFDPVECETQIVLPTPVMAVDTANVRIEKHTSYTYDYDWTTIIDSVEFITSFEGDIAITFKDSADIAGYYTVKLDLFTRYADGYVSVRPISYTSNDMVFRTNNRFPTDDDEYDISPELYLFSDELFDGREYTLKIRINSYSGYFFWPEKDSKITTQEIRVTLQSLSPSWYMYLKTSNADSDSDFFTEPVQIYTNVKGGIGVFGNYSNASRSVKLNYE
jgi:hypothetical protein